MKRFLHLCIVLFTGLWLLYTPFALLFMGLAEGVWNFVSTSFGGLQTIVDGGESSIIYSFNIFWIIYPIIFLFYWFRKYIIRGLDLAVNLLTKGKG